MKTGLTVPIDKLYQQTGSTEQMWCFSRAVENKLKHSSMNLKVLMLRHAQSLASNLMFSSYPFTELCVSWFGGLAFVLIWLGFWDRVSLWSPWWLQTLDLPDLASRDTVLEVCISMTNFMHDWMCCFKSWQNEVSAHVTAEQEHSISTSQSSASLYAYSLHADDPL